MGIDPEPPKPAFDPTALLIDRKALLRRVDELEEECGYLAMDHNDLATLVRTYLATKDALFLGTDWLEGRRLWDAWHRADAELRRAVQGTTGAMAATETGEGKEG